MNLKVKQRIPLKIKRMGINGEGIGFYKKTLVFVPGALKGEDIFCQITAVKRNFAQARLLTINKKSKFRVEPKCPIYKKCGGCQIMHLRYDKQLEFKDDLIAQSLKKFKPAGYENSGEHGERAGHFSADRGTHVGRNELYTGASHISLRGNVESGDPDLSAALP